MAVQFRAASSGSFADATSGSVTAPAFTAGDLMVLAVATDAGVTITTPTGWTLLPGSAASTASGHTDGQAALYKRTAQAGDTSWTLTLSSNGTTAWGVVAMYDDGAATIDATSLASVTTGGNPGPTSQVTPTVTTPSANARVLSIWTTHYFDNPGVLTVDAATTQRLNVKKQNGSVNGFTVTAIADEAQAVTGATSARTATLSGIGQNWVAYQVAIGTAAIPTPPRHPMTVRSRAVSRASVI